MNLIYVFIMLLFTACGVIDSEPDKREVLDGTFECEGRESHTDFIRFNVRGGFAKGEFYLPNSYYGTDGRGVFNGVMSESACDFKVYGGVYVNEDVVIEESYVASEFAYVYQNKYSVDSLIYSKDTIIYSHDKANVHSYDSVNLKNPYYSPSYGSLTFDEDTLVWKAIAYENHKVYENQDVLVDSIFSFSEAKGDLNNEFRLRDFESTGLFSSEGYWIDCKRVGD